MPHCVQSSLNVRYTSLRKIAFVGHVPTQAPQCMHSMSSIAMMPLSRTDGRTETASSMALPPLLDRNGELLLDFLTEVRSRVVRAERDHLAVGCRVVDHAPLHALDVVVVVVLEVHAPDVHRGPAELAHAGLVALREHRVQDLQELPEAHALRRVLLLEVLAEQVQRLELARELDLLVLRLLGQLPHVLHEALDVDEPGDWDRILARLEEQVRGEAARRVARERGLRGPREGGHELADRRHEGHGVPVVAAEVPGLLLEVVREVRQGVPQLPAVLVRDPPRQRNRLVVHALDHVAVLDREVQDLAGLVVVEGVHHRRNEDDGRALPRRHLPDLLDDPQLDVHERAPPGFDVILLLQPVELKVDRVEARLHGPLQEALLRRELDPVRRDLNLREAHLLRRANDLVELRVDRRLPARELDRRHGDRPLRTEDRELVHDLLVRGLKHITGRVRVREADRALQVAPVREVDVAQRRVRVVKVAQAALVRAYLRVRDLRVRDADAVERPVLRLQVQFRVGPADLLELPVLLARLLHHERAVVDVQRRGDDLQALRAQGARPARESLLQLRGHRDHRVFLPGLVVHLPDEAYAVIGSAKGHVLPLRTHSEG